MADEAQQHDAGEVVAKSAHFDLRSAWIALVAGVVGALISAVSSYIVSDREGRVADERARMERQLTAYSQFLADSEDLETAHFDFVRLMVTNARYDSNGIATIKKPVDDAFRKVNQDVSVLNLIGSDKASLIANDIFVLDLGRYGLVRGIELSVNTRSGDEVYDQFKEQIRKSIDADKERRDL